MMRKTLTTLILIFTCVAWTAQAAILNFVGFETGHAGELHVGIQGTGSIQSSVKRTGTYAFRANPTTTGTGYAYLAKANLDGIGTLNTATVHVSGYFRYGTKAASNNEQFFGSENTSDNPKFALRLNSSGTVSAYDSTGTIISTGATVLSQDTWYLIDVVIGTGTSAAWDLNIEGVDELSGTSDLTTLNNKRIWLGKRTNNNSQTVDYYYDDFIIDDTAIIGAQQTTVLIVDGDGTYTTWTGDSTAVAELPPDDATTKVVSTATVGNAETFTMGNTAITGTIRGISAILRSKRNAAANGTIRLRVRSGSTNYDTATFPTFTNYNNNSAIYVTDPNTSVAWTVSGINAVEIGAVEASASILSDVTVVYAMVNSTPSTKRIIIVGEE